MSIHTDGKGLGFGGGGNGNGSGRYRPGFVPGPGKSLPAPGSGPGFGPAAGGPPGGAPGPAEPDVKELIRAKTQTMTLRSLERQGFRKVKVLDMATIHGIVTETVDKALKARGETLSAEERRKVEADARAEVVRLLEQQKQLVAEKGEAVRMRGLLDQEVERLRAEIATQQKSLEDARARNVDDATFSLSTESFGKLEDKIRRLFSQLMDGERRLALADAGPAALKGLTTFERELASVIDRIIADERDRYSSREREAKGKEIELLERRIEKLNKALSDTERALCDVSAMKGIDGGLASIYKSIQGLDMTDPKYGRKKELLAEVFKQNLVLQNRA